MDSFKTGKHELSSELPRRHWVLFTSVVADSFPVRTESVREQVGLARLPRLPLLLAFRVAAHVLAQRQIESRKVLWVAEPNLLVVLLVVFVLTFPCVDVASKHLVGMVLVAK